MFEFISTPSSRGLLGVFSSGAYSKWILNWLVTPVLSITGRSNVDDSQEATVNKRTPPKSLVLLGPWTPPRFEPHSGLLPLLEGSEGFEPSGGIHPPSVIGLTFRPPLAIVNAYIATCSVSRCI